MTPEQFAAAAHVSRETMDALLTMDRVLVDWAARHNLIARSTFDDRWERHYLDSAQLFSLLPEDATDLADLGSGAGFPGLVLAAMLAPRQVTVTLIESTGKKADFLNEAASAMALTNLTVIPERIETVKLSPKPGIVTARALARLDKLLGYAAGIGRETTKYFFLKGQDVEVELNEASTSWQMDVKRHKSITSPSSTILEIGNLSRA